MNPFKSKKGLGRGLSSLIGDIKALPQTINFLSVMLFVVNYNQEKILINNTWMILQTLYKREVLFNQL